MQRVRDYTHLGLSMTLRAVLRAKRLRRRVRMIVSTETKYRTCHEEVQVSESTLTSRNLMLTDPPR